MDRISGSRRPFQRAQRRLGRPVALLAIVAVALALTGCVAGSPQPPDAGSGSAGSAGSAGAASGSGAPASSATSYLLSSPRAAAPIALTGSDGAAFSLASLRGENVLVFFGYTHCPDVCPATIGILGEVLAAAGQGTRAVFVTVDPERDTVAWLKEYSPYLPNGFVALTGTAAQIRATADAWSVRYARVDSASAAGYQMSHTADVFFVDAGGTLRADFPFGTTSADMTRIVRAVAMAGPIEQPGATAAASGPTAGPVASAALGTTAAPAASPGTAPAGTAPAASPEADLQVDVVSTSVWAGTRSPVILVLSTPAGRLDDPHLAATVQLRAPDGSAVGSAVTATPVQPPGERHVFQVAALDIPTAGAWSVDVTAVLPSGLQVGHASLTALDPGRTPAAGSLAPVVHTPTLDDVAGDARAITTDPQPDLRLSRASTTDALAAHTAFVLVIDSVKFRVSSACGKAVGIARYLVDRWPGVTFIHLEPYAYTLVTDTPVLAGDLADPPLTAVAAAWGIGDAPWGPRSMPWAFVVDSTGTVRAVYQGVMGTDDLDVILALIAAGG